MKRDWAMRLAAATNGLYAAPRLAGPARLAARSLGWRWHDLDLADVHDKDSLLARCAGRLALPAYFGRNWDALAECVRDPAWMVAPGAAIWWHGGAALAHAAAQEVTTALEILADAAREWRGEARAFIVLVEPVSAAGTALASLD